MSCVPAVAAPTISFVLFPLTGASYNSVISFVLLPLYIFVIVNFLLFLLFSSFPFHFYLYCFVFNLYTFPLYILGSAASLDSWNVLECPLERDWLPRIYRM